MSTGAYGEATFAGFCRWEHRPKDLIKNWVTYDVPYFGATPVYSNVRTGDVITEALTNLYVEWNFNRGTMTKSKVDSSRLQKVTLEFSIHKIKIRTTGGAIALDPARIVFCDISLTNNVQKPAERFLTLVANEDAHNAAYVFMCESTVATKIKRTVLQLFDMCVMNEQSEKQKQSEQPSNESASTHPTSLPQASKRPTENELTTLRASIQDFGLKCRGLMKQIESDQRSGTHDLALNVEKLQGRWEAASEVERTELSKQIGAEVRKFEQNLAAVLIQAKASVSTIEEAILKKAEQTTHQSPLVSPRLWDGEYEKPVAGGVTNSQWQELDDMFGDKIEPPTVPAPPVPKRANNGKKNTPSTPTNRSRPLVDFSAGNPFGEFPSNPPPMSPRSTTSSTGSPVTRRPSIKDKVIGQADPAFWGSKKAAKSSSPPSTTIFANSLLLESLNETCETDRKEAKTPKS